ncbi:MAG: tetratricopeptide repeat protein [Bacteroidetes bacterium]|nr:tetratricopeptide repeat protein [Bacteroidota bacterium]
MNGRKFLLPLVMCLLSASVCLGQSEVFKNVVNNLAFYKQKKDLKYLAGAKKSVDSLIKTHLDSIDLPKNVYKLVVYSSIAYIDSANKLKQPANFFDKVCKLQNKLASDKKIYRFQPEMDYSRRCIANVYLRQGFAYMRVTDYYNAIRSFREAQLYAPEFKELNAYIAYANNRLGNLMDAARYYTNLLKTDSTNAQYVEAASSSFKAIGDTSKALQALQKGRKHLPDDKFLLLDEANIYCNRRDYRSLEPLLTQLLDQNPSSAELAFTAANCYDHLNDFDKAESLYLRSIELNNSMFDPVYNLGILYFKEGISKHGDDAAKDVARAGQWLEKASEISPNDVKCLQLLQMVYARAGNQDQADKINSKLKLLTNQ